MATVNTTLWEHQFGMLSFAASRKASLLACDMGTGKTLATLAMAVADKRINHVLIVASKLACSMVWEPQIRQHVSGCFIDNVTKWSGTVKQKAGTMVSGEIGKLSKTPVPKDLKSFWLINYDIVWREPILKVLMAAKFDLIIVDESHRIAAHNSKVSRGLHRLGRTCGTRICLTGTPDPEGKENFFGQMRFLDDRVFGTNYENFLQRYTVRIPIPTVPHAWRIIDYVNQEEFRRKLKPFVHQVTKADAKLSLPPVTHAPMRVQLNSDSRRAYNDMARDLYAKTQTGEIVAANALVKGLRLQQITSGQHTNDIPEKLLVVYSLLENLPKNEPIVFFAMYTKDIAAIEGACSSLGIRYSEVSGNVSQLDAWNSGDTQALVVQIDSGAESIDLTRACYAAFYSITWSGSTYRQALARLDRPGQTRPVTYYHLIAENTIDERIYSALQQKRDTSEAFMAELRSMGR